MTDYLDRLIELARIRGEINVLCRFDGKWHIRHDRQPNFTGVFHIISKGECDIIADNRSFHLTAGDMFFLPYGLPHSIGNSFENGEMNALRQNQYGLFKLLDNHQTSYNFEMFCGYIRYSRHSGEFLNLPEYWLLSADNHPQIKALLTLLQNEATPQVSGKSVVDALCNVLFSYFVRDYLQHNEIHTGLIAALREPRLRNAVNAVLQRPEQEWNMENLAQCCAMSRANFIRLFKQKTAMAPGQFLVNVRMQKARLMLRESNKSILAVALSVGYKSESHFSRMFKQRYGMTPARFRAG